MITLVATHGRDNLWGNPIGMGQEFERSIRFGLQRVEAPYAGDIPYRFAFYGDLWRPDERAKWEPQPGTRDLDELAAIDSATDIQIGMAQEILENAGAIEAGAKGLWDSLAQLIGEAERYLPGFVGKELLRDITKDTSEYLTIEKLRTLTIERAVEQIQEAREGVILLAHSMGTIVCYDLLMRHPDLPVRAYISFGSPLGMRTIISSVGTNAESAPFPPKLPRWINLYNQEDFVASVRTLAPLYKSNDSRKVEDIDVGKMQSPALNNLFAGHSLENYLSSMVMGKAIRSVVDAV